MALTPPENFDFPFTPYDIQHDFMSHLYDAIERRKFGIFESPTGTGKSLSIICGALRWLKDHNELLRKDLKERINELQREKQNVNVESSDWIASQTKEIELTHKLNELILEQRRIEEYDSKIEKLTSKGKISKEKNTNKWTNLKKTETQEQESVKEADDDDDLVLEDTVTGHLDEGSDEDEIEDKYMPTKIFICSRTHSQLSQFVGEIVKSPFGSDTRAISLASRQNYCINSSVTKLKNVSFINERCLDMQKNKTCSSKTDSDGKVIKRKRGTGHCPFYKPQNIDELRDLSLAQIQDVEDLVSNGKTLNACPYYASRKAAEDAQIVLVPYNTLLHKPTREANGIKLKNNVVIIDEAHNLLEALAQMHSTSVTQAQLHHAHIQLQNYKQRYSTRFSSKNLLCINQITFIVKKLLDLLNRRLKEMKTDSEIQTIPDFVSNAQIDNYNMYKLVKFCKDSKIAQKLHGFAMKYPQVEHEKKATPLKGLKDFLQSIENKQKNKVEVITEPDTKANILVPTNSMLAVISLLESLTYAYEDGRTLIDKKEDASQSRLQFLMLNPAMHFKEIVAEARSIIVAGGTMKPNFEFRDRLFISAGASPEKIVEFSCDHIIPPENILPIILTKGSKKESLLFNLENRHSLGDSLKQVLIETCRRVKGGVVVFFPSYKYEAWFWQQAQHLNFERAVFREPQDSASVEKVLNSYAESIRRSKNGAVLFSVVGGKLSEGLNFSDDLGRCVIVVGMPYANIKAADLIEKMSYLDKTEGSGAGQKFYENLCMKAVNQCIGRAVRHRNDYATVILLDQRYSRASTKDALPGWIKRSLKVYEFDECFDSIEKFFKGKKRFA